MAKPYLDKMPIHVRFELMGFIRQSMPALVIQGPPHSYRKAVQEIDRAPSEVRPRGPHYDCLKDELLARMWNAVL